MVLIGTSHIAAHSIKEITSTIEEKKPHIVAVELDQRRLHALLTHEKPKITFALLKKVGVKGFAFAVIGSWVQRKLGKLVGVEPGADMLAAVKLAQQHKIPLALIDQDIELTLQRFSKALSWRERFRFFGDLLRALFFQKHELRRLGLEHLDLTRVPSKDVIKRLTKELHDRYPNIYRVLITERNQVMAKRLYAIMVRYPNVPIVAVVGAGHEDDIVTYLHALERQHESSSKLAKV